jgi:hypothetical protein
MIWSPRQELIDRLPQLWSWVTNGICLFLRALAAIGWGDQWRCNVVLDAIVAEEERR